MTQSFRTIGIIGGGAWGTALATVARRADRAVLLWAHEREVAETINTRHENVLYLPGLALDPTIKATDSLADLAGCDLFLLAPPAQHLRTIAKKLAALPIKDKAPVVICAKGIEEESAKLLSDVTAEALPHQPLAVLSGPSFAAEVARDLPAALTLATKDKDLGARIIEAIGTRHFRLYLTDDVVGAQIGGAVKNVLAVACGIVAGRGMGDNARAALITRGLAEMTRLGAVLGARGETLAGLSGLGDLVLTCSSLQSRNMSLGAELGKGKKLADILASRNSVAEGVTTAHAAATLAGKVGVEMPIVQAVHAILSDGANIEETIEKLLARPPRQEFGAG
jgi:glycerol-3-phosphate dehydrogenase (NAD(P)+)